MLEELSLPLAQLARLAETVAARLSRGDSAAEWLPQLAANVQRFQDLYAAADDDTRAAVGDRLIETAELIRLAATCGDEWLDANRSAVDTANRLRRVYGLDAESPPLTLDWATPSWPPPHSTS